MIAHHCADALEFRVNILLLPAFAFQAPNQRMKKEPRGFVTVNESPSKVNPAENHKHHASIHFMFYNFCRIHETLRVTPAMQAGLTDHVWDLEEIVALIEKD
jgi:hypothetical protein